MSILFHPIEGLQLQRGIRLTFSHVVEMQGSQWGKVLIVHEPRLVLRFLWLAKYKVLDTFFQRDCRSSRHPISHQYGRPGAFACLPIISCQIVYSSLQPASQFCTLIFGVGVEKAPTSHDRVTTNSNFLFPFDCWPLLPTTATPRHWRPQ